MVTRPGIDFDPPTPGEIEYTRQLRAEGYTRTSVYGLGRPFYLLEHKRIRLLGHCMGCPFLQIDFVEHLDSLGQTVRKLNVRPTVLRAIDFAEADRHGLDLIDAYRATETID
jgi:hypothetical protein